MVTKDQVERLLQVNSIIVTEIPGHTTHQEFIIDPHELVLAFGYDFDDCTPPNVIFPKAGHQD